MKMVGCLWEPYQSHKIRRLYLPPVSNQCSSKDNNQTYRRIRIHCNRCSMDRFALVLLHHDHIRLWRHNATGILFLCQRLHLSLEKVKIRHTITAVEVTKSAIERQSSSFASYPSRGRPTRRHCFCRSMPCFYMVCLGHRYNHHSRALVA